MSNSIEEAVSCYRSALRLQPNHPHAFNNLGCALRDMGMTKEAMHCLVTAARLSPAFAVAHCNIGSLMMEHSLFPQAFGHLEEALRLDDTLAEAHLNKGNFFKEMGDLHEALASYSTAIQLSPTMLEALSSTGMVFDIQGRCKEAIEQYTLALEAHPSDPALTILRTNTKRCICIWDSWSDDQEEIQRILDVQRNANVRGKSSAGTAFYRSLLLCFQPMDAVCHTLSNAEIHQVAKRSAQRAKNLTAMFAKEFKHRSKSRSGRIRLGYVSSDFSSPDVAHMTHSLLEQHDTSRFDVTCYSLTPPSASDSTEFYGNSSITFRDLSGLHFADAAKLVHENNIHILINLGNCSKGAKNEIFAMRPSPLQIGMHPYGASFGADFLDYVVTDKIVTPVASRENFTEKLLLMPHSYLMNDHKLSHRYILDVDKDTLPLRADFGISEDKFVFCNFSPLCQVDPTIFSTWINILKRVPNAVLWLTRHTDNGASNLIKEARLRGVREEQLVFSSVTTIEQRIKQCLLADLYIDTVFGGAGMIACDALWAGTPVLTLEGRNAAASSTASALASVGLGDLVASSLIGYFYSK